MKKNKLLKYKFPELVKEWDEERNAKTLDSVQYGSGYRAHWICSEGHRWIAQVASRTNPHFPTGCPYCKHNPPPTEERNFGKLYPELLKEWDYEQNNKLGIDPFKVSPKSAIRPWWKCKYGHTWRTRVAHRANGSGCPNCNHQSSKLQIFIFCEVQYFFPNAEYRKKINNLESDIYLPDEKIAIELDCERWHKKRTQYDIKKIASFTQSGITVISIREDVQPVINELTITYNKSYDPFYITRDLMGLLGKRLNRQDLLDYTKRTKPANEREFYKQIANYPMSITKTLLQHNPELASEWDTEKNGDLTPSNVAPFSHHYVYWKCKEGHSWQAAINNRNQLHQGCPHCQEHSSLSYSKNKNRDPLHPKRIRERKQYCKDYYQQIKENQCRNHL